MKDSTKLILLLSFSYLLLNAIFILYCLFINVNFVTEVPDQGVFITRGSGILSGLLPYKDFHTDAAPLSPYIWAIIVLVSNLISVKFDFVVRIFFSFCLIISSLFLFEIQKNKANPKAFIISLIYGLNPFFLYLNIIWGSDECMIPLLILGSILIFEKNKPSLATVIIALGSGIKYFPILLAPLIWVYCENWKKRVAESSLLLTSVVSIFLPFYFLAPEQFLFQFEDSIEEILGGNQGILSIIQAFFSINIGKFNFHFKILTVLALLVVGVIFLVKRKNSYMDAFPFLATFLVFYPKFQISYVVLLFPFLIELIVDKKNVRSALFYTVSLIYGDSANALIVGTLISSLMIILYWVVVALFYIFLFSLVITHFTQKTNDFQEKVLFSES